MQPDLVQTPDQPSMSRVERGLDALDTAPAPSRRTSRTLLRLVSPLLAIGLFIVIWQVLFSLRLQPDYILPGPQQVLDSLIAQAQAGILVDATVNSLRRGIQGFLIAIVIATPIGVALGLNQGLRACFGPILTGLQQLPSVAWVPAAIIWFGLSDATIYAVVLLGAIPSIANGLIAGIDQTPPLYTRAGTVLGARGLESVVHIVLPASWPGYLAGLEQGWAFAWRSLMAAELIAVSPALGLGLGQILDVGRQLGDMALVLASIGVIMAVGIFVERLVFFPLRQRTLSTRGLL